MIDIHKNIPIELKQNEDQNYQVTLLAEYEFCQKDGHVLEGNIWQSATVFIGLSLGGISFLATQPISGRADLLLHWFISLAAISVLSLWRRVLRRWYYIRAVWYYRMTEIEQRLGMWRERYLSYLNQVASGRFQPQEEEEFRFKELYRCVAKQQVSATRQSINRIINILILVWLALAVYSGMKFIQTQPGQDLITAIRNIIKFSG
jgi:hypothetical protein